MDGISEAVRKLVRPIYFCIGEFEGVAEGSGRLPSYKGSMLRGAWGAALRRLVCPVTASDNCEQCLLRENCVYMLTFETPRLDSVGFSTNFLPHPIVFDIDDSRRRIEQGAKFLFRLIIIGRAARWLPYFVIATQRMLSRGLGIDRVRMSLRAVYSLDWQGARTPIFNAAHSGHLSEPVVLRATNIPPPPTGARLSVSFVTPTRIKVNGQTVSNLDFPTLIRALLRRITLLARCYCQAEPGEVDYQAIIAAASQVKVDSSDISWRDWHRHSSRQKRIMNLGGLVGHIVFSGPWRAFWPLICLGQFLHVGKNTTFGLGKYEVRFDGGQMQ